MAHDERTGSLVRLPFGGDYWAIDKAVQELAHLYAAAWLKDDVPPYTGDLMQELFEAMSDDDWLTRVQEAVDRKDHFLYGYWDETEFYRAARKGIIINPQWESQVTFADVEHFVMDYFRRYRLFVSDGNGWMSQTIREVW